MSITNDLDILFLVWKGYLVVKAGQLRQVTLMTIMNIGVDIILKTLSISFRMVTKILKEHKGVHTKVQGFLDSSTKKKNKNIKYEKFKKMNKKARSRVGDSFVIF